MAIRMADRLVAQRRRHFVGRDAERRVFLDAVAEPEPPFTLLYIWGPAGIGKTSLLAELASECDLMGIPALKIDARTVTPSPQGLLGALRGASPLHNAPDPWDAFRSLPGRHVLFIDAFERLAGLVPWLRSDFLPQLEDTLVVLASTEPLPTEWATDLGWQGLIRVVALRNLSCDESSAYLLGRAVPEEQHEAILSFTHGHPLALSLVADEFAQRPGENLEPFADPNVIKTLLQRFVQNVPGPAHRVALEASAVVRWTTEDLLCALLDLPDVHDLFEWLRGLSFVESGPHGLAPHDLAREALLADLRWRNPESFAELHNRARSYYQTRMMQSNGPIQQHIVSEFVYLHRDNPSVRPYLDWEDAGSIVTDTLCDSDRQALLAMVSRNEGPESAAIAQHWLERQPQGVLVFRNAQGLPAGYLHSIALQQTSEADRAPDPAARSAWQYVQRQAPLRSGERATLFRFWMSSDGYQAVSPIQSKIVANIILHFLTKPGLALTLLPAARPDYWAPLLAYLDMTRAPDADFEVEGRRYGVFGRDWRVVPVSMWLDRLAQRETARSTTIEPPDSQADTLLVLNETDFAQAVRSALRARTSIHQLTQNPLMHTRLVANRAGPHASTSERVAVLQAVLDETLDSLRQSPRESKLYRALDACFVHPAPTQEQSAEALDLPFSTFRRHMEAGVTRVAQLLWQRELDGGM